jgi:hypothetical protein
MYDYFVSRENGCFCDYDIIIMGLTPVSSPEGDIRGVSYFRMKVERNWWTVDGRVGREKRERLVSFRLGVSGRGKF